MNKQKKPDKGQETEVRTISLTHDQWKQLDALAQYLGTTRTEAVRFLMRYYRERVMGVKDAS